MILLFFAAAGLVFGFVAGGKFSNIKTHDIKWLWMPIAAFLIKGAAPYIYGVLTLPPGAVPVVSAVLHYGLLVAFAVRNWRAVVWPLVFGFGTLLNFAVILLNGGAMPVAQSVTGISAERAAALAAGEVFGYTLADGSTRLGFWGDVLMIGFGGNVHGYASIGDLFIGLGVGILCFQILRPAKISDKQPAGAQTETENMDIKENQTEQGQP